jgi:uncharacterized protein YdiU (UPF0061 family)
MEKLPPFDSEKYEFIGLANITMKNTLAIQAIQTALNTLIETINELIDENPSVDLESFKATLLKELATLLGQKTEFEFSNSLFDLLGTERTDLRNCFISLEQQLHALTERVSQIESALCHEKVEETEKVYYP